MRKHERCEPSDARMVVQTVQVGRRTYELRYNRCGKGNCSTCYPVGGRAGQRVGHGPYWYLCASRGRRWMRVYVGKTLNTAIYVTADGGVDWAAVKQARRDRAELRGQRSQQLRRATCLGDKMEQGGGG